MIKTPKSNLVNISLDNVGLYEKDQQDALALELDGLFLEIKGGEFVALVGPSSSEQTDILRIIAGLKEPVSGRVQFNGQTLQRFSPDYKNMAMVFQSQALYPHLNVRKNLEFGLKLADLPRDTINARIAETANLIGISDILNSSIKQISKPQRQLVAIARAFVKRPQVLLFDNPISELDPQLKVRMQSVIKRFCLNSQVTVIYATHNPSEAMTLGDRIAYIDEGKIQQIGTSYELYNNPVSEDVARFISYPEMNFLEFETEVDGDRYTLNLINADFSIHAPRFYEKFAKVYQRAKIGIRAENLKIVSEKPNAIPMVVEMQEFFGSSSILYVSRESQSLSVEIPLNEHYEIGETVYVELEIGGLHFFANGKFIV